MQLPTINAIRGLLISESIADPAPGAVFTITIPDRRVYLIHALHFDLAATGGGAARLVTLTIDDGTHIFYEAESPVTIASGQSGSYSCADFGFVSVTPALVIPITLPDMPLPTGFRISLVIANVQVGDQISGTHLFYEKFAAGN